MVIGPQNRVLGLIWARKVDDIFKNCDNLLRMMFNAYTIDIILNLKGKVGLNSTLPNS